MTTLKRPKQRMPALVKNALEQKGLKTAYTKRPAYQRNDYLWWINDAKQPETKKKRLGKMMTELKAGRGYMGQKWTPQA